MEPSLHDGMRTSENLPREWQTTRGRPAVASVPRFWCCGLAGKAAVLGGHRMSVRQCSGAHAWVGPHLAEILVCEATWETGKLRVVNRLEAAVLRRRGTAESVRRAGHMRPAFSPSASVGARRRVDRVERGPRRRVHATDPGRVVASALALDGWQVALETDPLVVCAAGQGAGDNERGGVQPPVFGRVGEASGPIRLIGRPVEVDVTVETATNGHEQ